MRIVDTAKLRYYMEKSGCKNILALSEASGVNRVTIAGMLNGKIMPSADVIDRIMVGANIPANEIGEMFFKQA